MKTLAKLVGCAILATPFVVMAQAPAPQDPPAVAEEPHTEGAPTFVELQDHTTLEDGEDIYQYWCWNCHGEGPGKPGTVALEAKYDDRPALLTERDDLNVAMVEFFVRNGVSIMPHFRPTQISDQQLSALAEYLAGND